MTKLVIGLSLSTGNIFTRRHFATYLVTTHSILDPHHLVVVAIAFGYRFNISVPSHPIFPTKAMASNSKKVNDGDKVTAESYGNLQDVQIGKEAWLLRMPNKLAEAFDRAPEGTILGELVFRKGGGKNSTVKPALDIHVSPEVGVEAGASAAASTTGATNSNNSTLPLHYSLIMTKDVPTMHPFTRHPNGSIKLHGTVTRTGNMQVQQDKNYRALLKDRILETSVHKKAYVKPVDANQVVQQTSARASAAGGPARKGGFGEAVSELGKRILEYE